MGVKAVLKIVKIGGNVIDDSANLESFLKGFSDLEGLKILVHGGGKLTTEWAKKTGLKTQMIDGRRITDSSTLEIATMVYAGKINKTIVAKLQSLGCNSIGLSGADLNCIQSEKRPIKEHDFGFVGDIKNVNDSALKSLLKLKVSPVLCSITHDRKGTLLNTNADAIASEVAIAMSKTYQTELYYCFEKRGVLSNLSDESSVIAHIDRAFYQKLLKDKRIDKGMLPKLENCFHALENNICSVYIGNADLVTKGSLGCTKLTL